MGFSKLLPSLPIEELVQRSLESNPHHVNNILKKGRAESLEEFASLISPAALTHTEALARVSQKITNRQFGKVIRLFAPIYLSNECINICRYCGFSRDVDIPRITISVDQFLKETRLLSSQGFRSLLIVAGEHPKYVSNGYVEECIRKCLPFMPSILLELGPLETEDYRPIVKAGAEGLVVYQETYHKPTYSQMHPAGPKKKYGWRVDTAERAYDAGFRRIGIGPLLGLYDWRYEAIALAAHARYLYQHCWKVHLTISLPRLRPASGNFQTKNQYQLQNQELVQLICSLRMLLPHVGIVLSTRELPNLRDGLVRIGITNMSAGSSTEPGGYSHFDTNSWKRVDEQPGEQFHIADERSPGEIADMIRSQGYEPVWKDFDQALVSS
ncbi:MAG: 2-iminoacetate synthase [Candidatus Moanabacter tarae]|uniref:2-iminoacetate synthase n=1 Tax=Candidatus Moanibacter tarae TaxID=2200854 RepID=A0A2Z4ALI5_9BACT|nr:MAG: 2-iminoacetate synthase [Candidatus Moanabacter tarae]|tara:strand:- start:6366 stop:7517 length:1152 start_codon:yes stop_codon:yes gene_type:complete